MNSVQIQLSKREYQLLIRISRGLSNKQIAKDLVLSEGTMKFYLSRLFRKCEVSDRLELALFGLRHFFQYSTGDDDPGDWNGISELPRRMLLEHPHVGQSLKE